MIGVDGITFSFQNVSVKIDTRHVLRNISASFIGGEFVALIGPNGAGKSTLLRALAGIQPVLGDIHIGADRLQKLSPNQRARSISLLPQSGEIGWPMSVCEVVSLGLLPHGFSSHELRHKDAIIIERVMQKCEVAHLAHRSTTDLSGGERRRVLVARLLAVQAPIVLADEPTASLDPYHEIEILRVLQQEALAGRIVIAAIHDLDLAMKFATRIIAIRGGEILADTMPANLIDDDLLKRLFNVEFAKARFDDGMEIIAPRI